MLTRPKGPMSNLSQSRVEPPPFRKESHGSPVGYRGVSTGNVPGGVPDHPSCPCVPVYVTKGGQHTRYVPTGVHTESLIRATKALPLFVSMGTTQRLPRRFDKAMRVLGELSESKSERVRLQAALRMSDILLEHQRSEERKAIAKERATARKAEATGVADSEGVTPPAQPSAEERARAFIASLKEQHDNAE